ncbi:hypothetical protein N8659_00775 [bacterium]|nr:hypothetical protein [bacterium]
MKTAFFYLLLGLGQLFGQDMKVFGKSNEESYAGKIVRIEIGENSLTNGQSFKFWERILERASDEEAKGIIFDLDTPGGAGFSDRRAYDEDRKCWNSHGRVCKSQCYQRWLFHRRFY